VNHPRGPRLVMFGKRHIVKPATLHRKDALAFSPAFPLNRHQFKASRPECSRSETPCFGGQLFVFVLRQHRYPAGVCVTGMAAQPGGKVSVARHPPALAVSDAHERKLPAKARRAITPVRHAQRRSLRVRLTIRLDLDRQNTSASPMSPGVNSIVQWITKSLFPRLRCSSGFRLFPMTGSCRLSASASLSGRIVR
jgi:hypothetical protein